MMPSVSVQPSSQPSAAPSSLPSLGDPAVLLENVITKLEAIIPQTKDIRKAIKSIDKAIKDLNDGEVDKASKDLLKAFEQLDCIDDLNDSCTTIVNVLLPASSNLVVSPESELETLIDDLKALKALPKRDQKKAKKAIKELEKAIEDLLKGKRKLIAQSQQEDFARNVGNITFIGVRDSPGGKGSKSLKGSRRPRSKSQSRKNNDIEAAKDLLKADEALDCQDNPGEKLAFACVIIADVLLTVLTKT